MSPILSLILNKIQEQQIVAPFVIVHGPWVDAQWSDIREMCQRATGFFAHQDVLDIKDYSSLLGKEHSLKVEYKKNTDSDLLHKQESYDDIWSREINDRLSMAPAGDMKILMIEHIDRATIGAANALLKLCWSIVILLTVQNIWPSNNKKFLILLYLLWIRKILQSWQSERPR